MKTIHLRAVWAIAMAVVFTLSVIELAHPAMACTFASWLCHVQTGQSSDVAHAWRAVALVSLYACVHNTMHGSRGAEPH